jgi:hypothetical protein
MFTTWPPGTTISNRAASCILIAAPNTNAA